MWKHGLVGAVLVGSAWGQVTQLVSPGGLVAPVDNVAISADGRYVVYSDYAGSVLVRDRTTGAIDLVPSGSGSFVQPSISANGRFVAFDTDGQVTPGDTNGARDVFVYDRSNHAMVRASESSNGAQGDSDSESPDISADGRFVVFESRATNLVPNDNNGTWDVFVYDRATATTERVSVSTTGAEGNGPSYLASISADGRFVAFVSGATNFSRGDTNAVDDVFVRDRLFGTTEVVTGFGGQSHWDTVWFPPTISTDGRYVAFDWSYCDACIRDLFVRDMQTGALELVSVSSAGQTANWDSYGPYISSDGRYVAFDSEAWNLAPGDAYGPDDMFVRDRWNGTTERVSVNWSGHGGNDSSGGWLTTLCRDRISRDGRFVVFTSRATNLVPSGGDPNGDAYVRNRAHEDYPILCIPGDNGVATCPCSNPPSSHDRGCDNSERTGGAKLDVAGGEILSSDSLYFVVSEAPANALAILLQGSRPNSGGAVFGQGIRCVGGHPAIPSARKTGSDGTAILPDFSAGDSTISERSAASGDPILPMHSRWYMVFYRDPVVLGGCPAGSTFNTTTTREVLWLP